jgi:hypothetical protein
MDECVGLPEATTAYIDSIVRGGRPVAVSAATQCRPRGWSPGRLASVTVFQMAGNLTDRQVAEVVRDRLSWVMRWG